MKCSNIKLLLSEYIDETLDEKARSLVDQHLRVCEKCQNEYASLKNIISELGELPKIKAPDDFLENLHARMESKFDLNKLFRKLFVPFKIKVPLELLTAAATAVIIIFFVNIYQKEKQLPELLYNQKTERLDDSATPSDTFGYKATRSFTKDKNIKKRKSVEAPQLKETSKMAVSETSKHQPFAMLESQPSPEVEKRRYSSQKELEEQETKTSRIAVSTSAKEQSLAIGKVTTAPVEKQKEIVLSEEVDKKELGKPIELALIVDPTLVRKSESTFADMDKPDKDVSDMESEPILKKKTPVDKTSTKNSKTLLAPGRNEGESPSTPEPGKEMLMETDSEKAFLQLTCKRIELLIKASSGKIISENVDEQTRQLISILAEIPSSNFTSFYSQLTQIGRLKQPLPKIIESKDKQLQINILLIPSE